MRHRTLTQHEASFGRYPGPLGEVGPKAADRRWIHALCKQECIQIELYRMERQKTQWKVAGLGRALAEPVGCILVLRRQV
ncbi:hypothetical protein Rhsp01_62180 [Rhizobium sp. NBRC 114257]|uniref:Uncharacterized protein n=1 Tax=Rhizobium dioscoreae TaxID=2653122 RepID=A0ABQ0ZDP3_9HYPH|nr:hypothetical protein RsS93_61930 [Rhizobium dioscoreae]GLU85042.1 hypothetical protein Rhsp01_62180 [Rhizobium sp. NBRC 114257]